MKAKFYCWLRDDGYVAMKAALFESGRSMNFKMVLLQYEGSQIMRF